MKIFTIIIVFALVSSISAFRPTLSSRSLFKAGIRSLSPLAMADTENNTPTPVVMSEADNEIQDPNLFDMNNRVRLGRSRDQDGKSNIWSIEPTMEVEEEDEGGAAKKNIFIAGAVIGTAIACLPLFSAFSKLFPDPADF